MAILLFHFPLQAVVDQTRGRGMGHVRFQVFRWREHIELDSRELSLDCAIAFDDVEISNRRYQPAGVIRRTLMHQKEHPLAFFLIERSKGCSAIRLNCLLNPTTAGEAREISEWLH